MDILQGRDMYSGSAMPKAYSFLLGWGPGAGALGRAPDGES